MSEDYPLPSDDSRPVSGGRQARVLVVEDDAPIRRLLSVMIGRIGVPCDAVADGRSALDVMHERQYDVLLLDLMMPVLSGYDVIEILKRDGQRPPTIIVVSAVSEAELARLDPAMVTQVVRKPFDFNSVTALVRDAFRPAAQA